MSVEVKGYIFVLTEKKCRTVISLISSQRCSFYIRKGNSNLFRLLKDSKRYFFLSENKTVQAVYQILKKTEGGREGMLVLLIRRRQNMAAKRKHSNRCSFHQ